MNRSVTVLVVFLLCGCGGSELESPTAMKLRGTANLYTYSAISNKGEGPQNEDEFRKLVRSIPDVVREANRVPATSTPEDLLVSDRDGQPFVVRYGTPIRGMSATSAPLVVHERVGKDGKFLVGYANSNVAELTAPELEAALTQK